MLEPDTAPIAPERWILFTRGLVRSLLSRVSDPHGTKLAAVLRMLVTDDEVTLQLQRCLERLAAMLTSEYATFGLMAFQPAISEMSKCNFAMPASLGLV